MRFVVVYFTCIPYPFTLKIFASGWNTIPSKCKNFIIEVNNDEHKKCMILYKIIQFSIFY